MVSDNMFEKLNGVKGLVNWLRSTLRVGDFDLHSYGQLLFSIMTSSIVLEKVYFSLLFEIQNHNIKKFFCHRPKKLEVILAT